VLLGYGMLAIANGCFYHDIFAATNFSALSLLVMTNTYFSLALLLLRGGGARYCNVLALSSLVNNHYGTNRLGSFKCIYKWRFGKGEMGD
jgi:hypothetical protein